MLRVFISGKITGTSDYVERFDNAESKLYKLGYEPVNPVSVTACLPATLTHEEYMVITIAMLSVCDAIYMIPGWEDSDGAKRELRAAKIRRMKILQDGDTIMEDKNYRLAKRRCELSVLETNISKLQSYIEQNEIKDNDCLFAMYAQLDGMKKYRDALHDRIMSGYY